MNNGSEYFIFRIFMDGKQIELKARQNDAAQLPARKLRFMMKGHHQNYQKLPSSS